jgi:hypothetical protein
MSALKIAVLILAMSVLGMAQTKATGVAGDMSRGAPPSAVGSMKAETPAEMGPVIRSVGRWSATVRNEPSPWNLKGSTDKGTMVMSKGPGGLSVIQDFRSTGPMGPYQGHAIIYWDTITHKQSSVYCDNISGCVFGVTKNVGKNQWSTEMEQEFQGKRMKMVSHGTVVDENTMHEEFTQSIDGGPMTKLMTIDYKRVGRNAIEKPTSK